MIDRLRAQAQIVSDNAPAELRASWLVWVGTLADFLGDVLEGQRSQSESLRALRSELTGIIHGAIRDYSAGLDAERAAIHLTLAQLRSDWEALKHLEERAASDRRVMMTMLGAIAEHIGLHLDTMEQGTDVPREPL